MISSALTRPALVLVLLTGAASSSLRADDSGDYFLSLHQRVSRARMQRADEGANVYGGCGPRLNEPKDPSEWLGKGGAKAKLANEKPEGETIAYDELIKRWSN